MRAGDAFGLGITVGVIVGVLSAGAVDWNRRCDDRQVVKPQRRTAVVNHFSAWDGMTVWSEEHGWEKVVRMSNTFDPARPGIVCELEKVID